MFHPVYHQSMALTLVHGLSLSPTINMTELQEEDEEEDVGSGLEIIEANTNPNVDNISPELEVGVKTRNFLWSLSRGMLTGRRM